MLIPQLDDAGLALAPHDLNRGLLAVRRILNAGNEDTADKHQHRDDDADRLPLRRRLGVDLLRQQRKTRIHLAIENAKFLAQFGMTLFEVRYLLRKGTMIGRHLLRTPLDRIRLMFGTITAPDNAVISLVKGALVARRDVAEIVALFGTGIGHLDEQPLAVARHMTRKAGNGRSFTQQLAAA